MGNLKIIGGEKKGFRLSSTGARYLRPTSGRVREALFNLLRGRIQQARFLDLFAGTGAIGLEALSRGARSCVLVESQRRAVELIRKNLGECGFAIRARVVRGFLPDCLPRLSGLGPFDLIYVDPPYDDPIGERVLRMVGGGSLVRSSTWLVYEHRRSWSPPSHPGLLSLARAIRYGDTVLSIFHASKPSAGQEQPGFDRFPTRTL